MSLGRIILSYDFKWVLNSNSNFGFKSGICLLIAPVPVHCFSITFISKTYGGCSKFGSKITWQGNILYITGSSWIDIHDSSLV